MTTLGERTAGQSGDNRPPFEAADVAAYEDFRLREQQDHTIHLTLRNGSALVRLAGDIDMVAAEDLNQVMESLDGLTTVVIEIDLAGVRFLDSSGLQPLIEATRRRRGWRLPPVLIGECSYPALRLFRILGVAANRLLDVDAWDDLQARFAEGRGAPTCGTTERDPEAT